MMSGQGHVVRTIQNQIIDDAIAHAYLFSGPRGVGKTTVARLLAKTVNCDARKKNEAEPCGECAHCRAFDENSALDIIEIDAASHTGVDNVRENIIEALRFSPVSGKYKVFIIDEVHMLSTSAFNALLKTLEEPPAYGIFVLATTEIHKIPQTIISRCQRFDFHRLTKEEVVSRLAMVLKSEKIKASESVLESIAKLSEGCLRDAESMLGQIIALGENDITDDIASIILPQTNTQTVVDIITACDANDAKTGINKLNSFVENGGSVKQLNDDLIEGCRAKMVDSLNTSIALAKKYSWYLEVFLKARITSSPDAIAQLPLEIAIIEICARGGRVDNADATNKGVDNSRARIEQVEKVENPISKSSEKKASFTLEELKSKWQRCIDETAKRNIALQLVLKHGEPIDITDEGVIIGFEKSFHFETMNQQKNLILLSEAINIIMQCNVDVFVRHVEAKAEKSLQGLADAFGGLVVE